MKRRRDLLLRTLTMTPVLAFVASAALAVASSITVQSTTTHAGTFAANLDLERNCQGDHVTIPDGTDYTGTATEEACLSLTANDVDVLAGADVTFRAEETIVLGSGFSVASGASFQTEIAVSGTAYVESQLATGDAEYWARFYIFPDQLALQNVDRFLHLIGYDTGGETEFVVGLRHNQAASENRVFIEVVEDDGGVVTTEGTNEVVLPALAWHRLELRWKASSGANDGVVEICVDDSPNGGVNCAALTGLDNDTGQIDSVHWGALQIPQGNSGSLVLDDFRAQQTGPIGGCSSGTCP